MSHALFPDKGRVIRACEGFLNWVKTYRKEEENKILDKYIKDQTERLFFKRKTPIDREIALLEISTGGHEELYYEIQLCREIFKDAETTINGLLKLAKHGQNLYICSTDFSLIQKYYTEGGSNCP